MTALDKSLLDEAWRLLMAAPVIEHGTNSATCEVCRWQEDVQAFDDRRRSSPETSENPLTLGKLILDTARGDVKERTLAPSEVESIHKSFARSPRRIDGAETTRHEPEELCPEPVETLDVTHIFDGEEVVTAGDDGQTWIATFGCYSEAAEFVKSLQADPGTTVVGLRNRRAVKSPGESSGRIPKEP